MMSLGFAPPSFSCLIFVSLFFIYHYFIFFFCTASCSPIGRKCDLSSNRPTTPPPRHKRNVKITTKKKQKKDEHKQKKLNNRKWWHCRQDEWISDHQLWLKLTWFVTLTQSHSRQAVNYRSDSSVADTVHSLVRPRSILIAFAVFTRPSHSFVWISYILSVGCVALLLIYYISLVLFIAVIYCGLIIPQIKRSAGIFIFFW